MLIYKKNFLTYILYGRARYSGRGLKGRAECRQTDVQTKNCQGAGSANSGAYYSGAVQTWQDISSEEDNNIPLVETNYNYVCLTKNCQGAGSTNSDADSACGLSACSLDRTANGLATSVSTQLWAWPNVNYANYNICIEPLQKLLYQN